jgi:uncharacterized membrane protein HdeD (DUF308 family)
MTVTEPTPTKRGTGWIVFAGVVLIIAGANMLINGLWALHATTQQVNSFKNQLLFSDTDLDTWGWIYVIVGAVVLLAGFFVFARSQWARWVGILAATVQAIFAFFWLFTPYWPGALIIIIIDMLVIYGLSAYGERDYV